MSDSNPETDPENLPTLPPTDPGSVAEQPTVIPNATSTARTTAIPALDGYEILDELGRGGMGVVYKARDTKLDRTVALKMVLGGKFASDDEIQRFRIEGEAAARLDHPGIVPIYEIGEADGNHFFSMKFIDGSALDDRLDDYQSDERKTAELLISIARAVQHAHQRGVLHRDLKPANVLLDEDGNPSVTDLGLAKRMDGESELTQTGLIMGTPGFMAPEQAAGQKDITTAADVFSLGAILYWLITGQAPFKGETAVQTVMSTIEGETPSARDTIPDADSDLDLICQKAMHKDPLLRYSSAAALADDLKAWLDGELLSVKAPTAFSVASLWIRKNLRTVLGACVAGVVGGGGVGGLLLMANLRNDAVHEYHVQELGPAAQTWVSYFIGLRNLGAGWQFSQLLMVPTIAVAAFLCVLLVRPKTREANIVASATCGLVAGILIFLTSAGWTVSSEYSIESGRKDLDLLSTAIWFETEGERELAKQSLIRRYPGLAEMDTTTRKIRTNEMVLHDLKTGIMPGLWMGVLVSLLFCAVPLTVTTVFSGMLWQQGKRGWEWFGMTWERGAYCLVFFLLVSFVFQRHGINPWILIIGLSGIAFALYLAVKEAHWFWRVAVIPVPFVAMFAVVNDLNVMQNADRKAGAVMADDELLEQARQMDRWLVNHESGIGRFRAAIAWLYLGNEDRYKFHCRKALAAFDNAYEPEVGSRLANMCLLRADLQDPESLSLMFELSESASTFESAVGFRWFATTRALAELRRENPRAAIEWNERCRIDESEATVENGYRHARSHVIDTLAHLALEDNVAAKKSLELAQSAHLMTRTPAIADGHDDNWVSSFVFQILEREAVSAME
ncbi:MAG: serine/threonine-protein kinase [Planctomycetaceae bacterium]